jgi:adenylate cyclase
MADMAGRQRLFRLRPTLMTAIVGLVLLTALAIGIGAATLTLSVTRMLIDQARAGAVSATREGIRDYFADASQFTEQYATLATRGALPFEDRDRLAAVFAEELRVAPLLHYLGYGDRAGWYVGAARYGAAEIVEYVADPAVDGGVPKQVGVAPNGTRFTPSVVDTAPYFATTRPWFKQGIAAPGLVWSSFYNFVDGDLGVSCMTRFTAPGATSPRGVFHADLRVVGVSDFLSTLHIGKHGAVFLVDRNGHRVVTPSGEHVPLAAAAIDAAAPNHASATLAHPDVVRVGRRVYEVVFVPAPAEGDIGLMIGVVVDLADVSGHAYRHAAIAGGVALITIILAVLCGRTLSSRIARPIVAIAADLGRVGAFAISREPSPQSFVREVSELGASVDRMKASLRSFGHYVPTDLVRRLLAQDQEAELGGEIRRLTIYFSDVANFTTISEGMAPGRLVEAVGRYLELMTGTITRHGGTVDKFIGDGIMAFFNAPEELLGHPRQACLAALDGQLLLAGMARETAPGEPVFHTRIGLGLGEVLVGNIGTPERFAYTLLGDEVNLASRLEGLNKLYGTAIIASDAVMAEAGGGFEWRRLDRVAVKGRRQGTLICELIGLKGDIADGVLEARALYEAALDLYFAGDFEHSAELFEQAVRLRPGDLGAAMMRNRCYLLSSAPPTPWDGIHVMEEK